MARDTITLTANELMVMTQELEPKRLRRLINGALKGESRRLRKAVVRYAVATNGKVRNIKAIADRIKGSVSKDYGVYVSASNRVVYRNRHAGKRLPIPLWLNGGAVDRYIGRGTYGRVSRRRENGFANRGEMRATNFMEKTLQAEEERSHERIAAAYARAVERTVTRLAKKLQ